ncbi:MAG: SCO family protein [Bryobacter sp.]|nr:SCO family protein [Bryobacter sp.]
MKHFTHIAALFAIFTVGAPLCVPVLYAQNEVIGTPKNAEERERALADKPTAAIKETEGTGVDEKLGQKIDLNLTFTGEDGYPHPLKEYFADGRPVILNLVYYTCPMLCNLTLNGQVAVLRELAWTPGKEFTVVTISIDPTETFEIARNKKQAYLSNFDKPASAGWHFLTDHQGNVKKLADQVGFRYRLDEKQEQYAHPSAIMVLSPEGMVSRYLYGIKFRERDLRLALTEAAKEKFGLTVERILLMCYHYDPNSKSYVMFATNFMRLGGLVVMIVLALFLFRMWRNDLLRQAPPAGAADSESHPVGNRT